ncbi:hypothetical protein Klosneuvirus_3_251 [Klosneuvirus KNV1]|uniref:Uncharacterized protein n=1 Tax=Klosneuvirus KNV1 TaxID=1977640 RepID=A0A1V0SK73_9VIRU|nr:hypothetical protein Klosneuvirus_3_251 [Klosneuvirus KNV1]
MLNKTYQMLSFIRNPGNKCFQRAYHSQSIMVNNLCFDKSKILNVTMRPSHLWINHPFILDITYDEPCKTITQIPVGSAIIYHENTLHLNDYILL